MTRKGILVPALGAVLALTAWHSTHAQSPGPVATGLRAPTKMLALDDVIIVAEQGNGPNSGSVSLVDKDGRQAVLISGLPSGFSAPNNDPSGPTAVHRIDNHLFIAIGVG